MYNFHGNSVSLTVESFTLNSRALHNNTVVLNSACAIKYKPINKQILCPLFFTLIALFYCWYNIIVIHLQNSLPHTPSGSRIYSHRAFFLYDVNAPEHDNIASVLYNTGKLLHSYIYINFLVLIVDGIVKTCLHCN